MIIDRLLLLKIGFVEQFGILLVFLATFCEAIPGLGLVIPGAFIAFIGGFFAKLGLITLWKVWVIAILGAILGDIFGYILGRYFKKKFLHKYGKYLLIKKEDIEGIGCIVCEHTGKSLILGRLNPVTRVFAPFIVGAHKVKFGKFMLFNIIGGLLYGFLFVSLGFIFGQGYQLAAHFEKWIVLVTIAIIALFYLDYFIELVRAKMENGGKDGSYCKKQDKRSSA